MCNKKKEEPDVITVLFVIFSIVAIVAVIFTMFKLDCIGDNETVVYSFIGIIATFVVISNYAQMVEIRNKTEKELEDMKEDIEKYKNNIKVADAYYGKAEDEILGLLNEKVFTSPMKITKDAIKRIKVIGFGLYKVELETAKKENGIIKPTKETKYYLVNLIKGSCEEITKEQFDNDL